MLLEGSVVDGAIVLDEPTDLPNGTRVRVEQVDLAATAGPAARKPIDSLQAFKANLAAKRDQLSAGKSLHESIAPFVGCLQNLPADTAMNHDHYILSGLPPKSTDDDTEQAS